MSVKPVAWMIPKLISFKGARNPISLQAMELEGLVWWDTSLIGDASPITDKHGVTHAPKPLYDAPAPELAEMLGRLVNAILRKSAENPDVVVDEAVSLLARITPK